MDSQIIRRVRLLEGRDRDRRGSVRFPLKLELRYSVVGHRGPAENGSGRIIDMSTSGLCFTADRWPDSKRMPRGVCLQRREAAHRDVQAFGEALEKGNPRNVG